MMNIITICGSMKFYDEMLKQQAILSKQQNIVLLPIPGNGDKLTEIEHKIYMEIHRQKIELADEVLIINVGGYIGDHTLSEIMYAANLRKPISFLEPLGV